MLYIDLKPDFEHVDERGGLIQLVHDGYHQINYITSVGSAVRGGHFHKINKELYYIIKGSVAVELEKDNVIENYEFKKGDMFCIPPFVKHTFKYLEDSALITMYDKGVELGGGRMDIYR